MLLGIQTAMARRPKPFLQQLEAELSHEYQTLLQQEQLHWFQRSRSKWLVQSEQNTKYFHTSILIRRACNKVCMLKDAQDEWVGDSETLTQMARNFYMQLYVAKRDTHSSYFPGLLPTLSHVDKKLLNQPVSIAEMKKAVFDMGPNRAPGPDGFIQPFFPTILGNLAVLCLAFCP